MFRNWFSSNSQSRRTNSLRGRERPLKLEVLEDRTVPSTLVVDVNDPTANNPGDNLYAQISEAVAAASPGDLIKVHAGTYAPFSVATNNMTISEASDEANPVVNAVGVLDGVVVNASGVTILGLTAANANRFGFLINGNDNTLRANTATNNRSVGIAVLSFPTPGILSGNTLVANTATGNGTGILALNNDGVTVIGNTSQGNRGTGIAVDGCNNSTVVGNVASGNSSLGLVVSGDHNRATGNTAMNNLSVGMQFGGNQNTITGNTASGNTSNGINLSRLNNSEIKGNLSQNNAVSGFALFGSSGNTLRGNIAEGNTRAGFVLSATTSLSITDINFPARTLRIVFRSATPSDNNLFQGNVAENNGEYGFYLLGASGNIFKGNSAHGNGFDGFRAEKFDIIAPSTLGVFTVVNGGELLATLNSHNNVFQGNTSNDNGGYGYYLDAVLANMFDNNDADGNGLGDFNFS